MLELGNHGIRQHITGRDQNRRCILAVLCLRQGKSAATKSARAVLSATITTSLGPAIESIPTTPKTNFFAAAAYLFPGPVILSTLAIDFVPKASAAIACARQSGEPLRHPIQRGAAATAGLSRIVCGGVVTTIRETPAT